jgi:hypothetical protein
VGRPERRLRSIGHIIVERRHMNLTDGLNFTLDPTWLFFSLIPSGIGLVLFVYGKKQSRIPQLVGGIVLMVYPILTPTVTSLVVVGVLVCVAVWMTIRAGW